METDEYTPWHWNYRIIKELIDDDTKWNKVYYYSIREVYYDKDGKPEIWSAEPRKVDAYHTEEDFRENFKYMAQAMERPVIEVKDNEIIS